MKITASEIVRIGCRIPHEAAWWARILALYDTISARRFLGYALRRADLQAGIGARGMTYARPNSLTHPQSEGDQRG